MIEIRIRKENGGRILSALLYDRDKKKELCQYNVYKWQGWTVAKLAKYVLKSESLHVVRHGVNNYDILAI